MPQDKDMINKSPQILREIVDMDPPVKELLVEELRSSRRGSVVININNDSRIEIAAVNHQFQTLDNNDGGDEFSMNVN